MEAKDYRLSMNEYEVKDILAITASVCTILQFLTGILVCQKIVQNRSTGDISSFPFVSGALSCSLWLRYGFLIHETSIILVNTIGSALFLGYVITFYYYSLKKSTVVRQFCFCLAFLICTIMYVQNAENVQEAQKHLGIISCIVTILFFAAPLATLLHVVRVKNTESLPYPLIFAAFVVSLQWLLYGIVLGDKFIQIPNFLGCILSAFQLSLFLIYPSNKKTYVSDMI